MESYDLMDYDAAKKPLNQALATAKKAKLDKDPVAAKAYLDLGIVAFAITIRDGAKVAFLVGGADRSEDPDRSGVQVGRDGEAARQARGRGGAGGGSGGGDAQPVAAIAASTARR